MSGYPPRARETYAEQTADDGEDYDCEDGDDDARCGCVISLELGISSAGSSRGNSPAPCVEGGNDGLHGDGLGGGARW